MCSIGRGIGRGRAAGLASIALALALVFPSGARAVPIFYSDDVVAGFEPEDVVEAGLTPAGSASSAQQIATSNSADSGALQVLRNSKRPAKVIKRPQNKGLVPSPDHPYVAKLKFKIIANQDLQDVILAFTRPTGGYLAGVDNVGVDVRKKVRILTYTSTDPDLELPAFFIGDMKAGKKKKVSLKVLITGPMPENFDEPGGYLLPSLGTTAFAANGSAPEAPVALLWLVAVLTGGLFLRPFARASRARADGALGLLAAAALIAAPGAAQARDESEVLGIRARTLAERGSCEQSMQVLDRIGPRTAEGDLWLGKCHVGERNYVAALPFLERARASAATGMEAELYLGIAHYHLGDLEDARQDFARARLGGVSNPQLDLYEGVLLLDSGEYEAAASAFGQARAEGGDEMQSVATFYQAVALRRAGRGDEADALFAQVAEHAEDSPWGARAKRATEPVNLLGPPRRWARITVGGGYDSNVVLKGNNVDLPSDTSGRSALFSMWSAEAGYELARTSHMQVGVIARYDGSAFNSLKEFNTQVPSIGGWLDYVFDERTAARARYDFAFMWTGHDSFAAGHTVDTVLFHEWGEIGRSELELGYYWLDYKYSPPNVSSTCSPGSLCGPPGVNEHHDRNRDGHGLVAGLTHIVPVLDGAHVRGGYRYHRYFARGNDYSYQGHEVHAGFDTELPGEIRFDSRASFTYQPYAHPSTYPDPDEVFAGVPYTLSGKDRLDKIFRLDVSMIRKLTRRTELEARYTFVDNDSNTDVFKYDRQIFGLYLTARFN